MHNPFPPLNHDQPHLRPAPSQRLVAPLTLWLALSACGEPEPSPGTSAEPSPPPSAATASNQEPLSPEQLERARAGKVRAYGSMLRTPTLAIASAQRRYEAFVDARTRDGVLLPPEADQAPFARDIAVPEGFFPQLTAIAESPPAMPAIETTLATYQRTLTELVGQITEAKSYYDARSFEGDDMARGRALHTTLTAAFAAFRQAADATGAAVRAEQRRLRDNVLAQLEQDPLRRDAFVIEVSIAAAEDALDEIRGGELDEDQRLRGIDADALTTALEQLRARHRTAAAFVGEQGDAASPALRAVIDALAAELAVLEDMARHLGGDPWDDEAAAAIAAGRLHEVSGTPNSLARAHMATGRAAAAWRAQARAAQTTDEGAPNAAGAGSASGASMQEGARPASHDREPGAAPANH